MEKCIEKAESYCKSYPRCYGCGAYREPTNADRIREMSDEELASWMMLAVDTGACNDLGIPSWENCEGKCELCILRWLKQPAKDGDNNG